MALRERVTASLQKKSNQGEAIGPPEPLQPVERRESQQPGPDTSRSAPGSAHRAPASIRRPSQKQRQQSPPGNPGWSEGPETTGSTVPEPPLDLPEPPRGREGPTEFPDLPRSSSATGSPRASPPEIPAPEPDALLAAWTTLEVLEPQPLPKPEDLAALNRQMIRVEEHPEPWTEDRYGPRGRQREVHWFVHLGEVDLSIATADLLALFPDDSPEKPRPTKGSTTMAVVVLDREGRPAEGKVFVSSFAWGYGKLASGGGLATLADFPEEERRLCRAIEDRLVRMDEDGEILPVTSSDLENLSRWLVDRLGLPAESVSLDPVFVRVPAWRRTYEAPEPELLNSFFLGELERVRGAFRSGHAGPALRAFVTGEPVRCRADVVRDLGVLEEAIEPGRIPLSRWPSRGRFPLVMMQQAAVNHVTRELSESGLVGINGPPGTGKTTLLRDIVAKVVLDRAIAMASFQDPEEAFTHVAPMSAGRGFLHLYRLDESLLGHEMVVASSNNKAVENVSREIPGIEAVADDMDPPFRYFASIADRVLGGASGREEADAGASWGLAAAVLGNSKNRRDFVDGFWWDRQRSMQAYLRGIVDGWDPEIAASRDDEAETDAEAPAEVLPLEDAPRDRGDALKRWRTARKRFREALERAKTERLRLETARRALLDHQGAEEAVESLRVEVEGLRSRLVGARREVEDATTLLERKQRRARETVADREALQDLRPGFFARLFGTRRHRQWRDRMAVAVKEVEEARREERVAEDACQEARSVRDAMADRLRSREKEAARLARRLEEIRATLSGAQAELGDRFPDSHFWSRPEEERQRLSPWLGDRFQAARDDLFAASFELHRAFLDAAAPRLRHNLGAAIALLKGRKLSERQEPARRSLWASLFLVVPLVSTTFASVSRMFGPLGREQLGWLLIDEAGQAVPQAAAGAMWRARRVVAIGDPMQIPPVVAMSQRLINAILAEHGLDPDAWAAPRSSVQSLADRASWFGTTLLTEEGDVWVGSPLRVHRRCQEPMFKISNRIAYDGLMVQATPPGPSAIGDVLGESGWFHVESAQPGHWCPAEGELAARLLHAVLEGGIHDSEIFFITPFRLVQAHLRKRLRTVVKDRVSATAWSWVNERVGTIHTFQGKEAEAVVLVLGAPSSQAAGARYWAGGTPNLLNVAASRAKRRLYVIGDRRSWREAGVFRTLASYLPERPWG